ncbi:MAG: hypothetical protein AAF086_04865 [Planctomycetota bacterium]
MNLSPTAPPESPVAPAPPVIPVTPVSMDDGARAVHARPRAEGSALILSLVTIVMLVMLGAAYLQVARTDRRTAAAVDTRVNQNQGSILRYIGQILAGDIPIEIGTTDTNDNEYFDYPFTYQPTTAQPGPTSRVGGIPAINDGWWYVDDQFAPTVVPGAQPNVEDLPVRENRASGGQPDPNNNYFAEGGLWDDPWLASTEPDFSLTPPIWPHVTNLQGVFLDLADIQAAYDYTGGGRPMPAQYLTTADNNFNSGDTFAVPALPMGSLTAAQLGVFADADGDNIADARWTWAPLPSDGGLAYVMAVRVLDNSALINLAAPSYILSKHQGTDETSRWLWPGELDLETPLTFIKSNANANSTTSLAFAESLLANTAANGGRNMGAGNDAFADRLANWLDLTGGDFPDYSVIGTKLEQGNPGTAMDTHTDPMRTYGELNVRSEELELRWRNGLNRSDDNTTNNAATTLENLDNAMFRDPGPLEPTWLDSTYTASVQEYFEENPRLALTTVSGSANYAQLDLNNSSADELAAEIESDFFNFVNAPNPLLPNTPAIYQAGDWTNLDEFTTQLAATLVDFRDQDSELTQIIIDPDTYMYGMEYLPFISEVYLQGRYDKTDVVNFPSPPAATAYDEVTWTLADVTPSLGPGLSPTTDSFAIAIELVNPWPWQIEIPDVEVIILDENNNATVWGSLDELTGGLTTMDAGEVIILTRDDTVGAGGDNTEITAIGTSTPTAPVTTVTQRAIPAGTADSWPVGTGTAGIVLAAQTDAGTRIGYQEFVVDELPESVLELYADTTGGAIGDTPGYYQLTALGTGDGLSALTVKDEDVDLLDYPSNEANLMTPSGNMPGGIQPGAPQAVTGTALFATALKGATSPSSGDALDDRIADYYSGTNAPDPGDEPWIIGNAGRFYRAGDLLRAVVIGPRIELVGGNATQIPVAEVWEKFPKVNVGGVDKYSIANAMLDLGDTAVVNNTTRNVSHAAYLMAKFTTLDSAAGLIPGKPNVNTMPERLLATIFPTTTPGAATTIANTIATLRDNPGPGALDRPAGTQGIQFVSQLAKATAPLTGVYDPAANDSGEVTDFNEYEPEIGGAAVAAGVPDHAVDGHTFDVEERTMLMNYLNQVASTRSDIYTAFVLVRAYPASDFSAGPTDEYRLLAVFDRSQVTGEGLPRILAVKRFAD